MTGRPGRSTTGIIVGGVVAGAIIVGAAVLLRMDTTGRKGPRLSREYTYDISEMRKVDPRVILYEPAGVFRTGFADSRAIVAGPDGRIYLAGDKAIRVLPAGAATAPAGGEKPAEIETTGPAGCLAVDQDGTIYAGVIDHVEVYDARGERKATWEKPAPKARLTSIAVTDQGVFVADAGSRVVLRYDRSGRIVARIGEKDPRRNVPGFNVPGPYFDLAMAPDGLLRVVNPGHRRIEAYTLRGDLEFSWGGSSSDISGFTGCCNPVSFTMLPDGGYVTCEKGLRRVKLYGPAGEFVGVVAPPAAFPAYPPAGRTVGELDVAVDRHGRILVLDPYTGEVKVFARKAEAPQ